MPVGWWFDMAEKAKDSKAKSSKEIYKIFKEVRSELKVV